MSENKALSIVTKNNRTCLSLRDEYGKIKPFQMQVYATSGFGKGLSCEGIIERWRESTGGVVLCISDPKGEAEFSFVSYLPEERYHTERLKLDGSLPRAYPCKLYHPFTFNIPKGNLPDINFFTIPIKNLSRGEWTILSESSFESESIKLLMRVSQDLGRFEGLFSFLHQIQSLVKGKKDKKKAVADPKNFYLEVGGGTAKSITEIAGLLSPFRTDYFLRKEKCPYALDWKEILNDSDNYHVFLSMWLKDEKQQQFLVLSLLQQIIANRQYMTKPILIVLPEIRKQCPKYSLGYKMFLSQAITEALSTVRSMGRGISTIADSQNWDDTSDGVKGSAVPTLFGQLNPSDSDRVVKSMGYKREIREQLNNMQPNSYFIAGQEDDGAFRMFFPRHMHKEPHYNWIEMYKRFKGDQMKRYDDLVKYMRMEIDAEEKEIRDLVRKKQEQEELEEQMKEQEKEERKAQKEKPKEEKKEKEIEKNEEVIMKICYETFHDETLPKKQRTYRKIAEKVNKHHATVKKFIEVYTEKLKNRTAIPKEEIDNYVGDGVMQEEVDSNYVSKEEQNLDEDENKTPEQIEEELARRFRREIEPEIEVQPDEEGVIFNSLEHKELANPMDTEFDYLNEVQTEDEED